MKSIFLVWGLLGGMFLFAEDIKPVSKVGKVVLQAPSGLSPSFDTYKVYFTKGDKRVRIQSLNMAYEVFAGEGCLSIEASRSPLGYVTKKCGFVVSENEKLIIPLSAVEFNWDQYLYKVSVGPRPIFKLNSKSREVDFKILTNLPMHSKALTARSFLFFEGSYEVTFGEVHAFKDEKFEFNVGRLKSHLVEIDIKDQRTPVLVSGNQVTLPHPVRSSTSRHVINQMDIVLRKEVKAELNVDTEMVYSKESAATIEERFSLSRFFPGEHIQRKMFVYRLGPDDKREHQFVVNNIVIPIEANSTNPVTIGLTSLNVHHLNEELVGFFKVYQRFPFGSEGVEARRINWLIKTNYASLLLQDILPKLFDEESDSGVHSFVRTGRHILVPNGWEYEVVVYHFDDLGEFREASNHKVDLKEN